jgi:hypothetical protein
MTLDDAIRNWQRWCTDTSDCYPHGYPPEWPMGRVYLPYKTMITEDEALDELEAHREPDRIWAERIEGWVQRLPLSRRVALQTHYIHWPESMGRAWDLSSDQLAARRARRLARLTESRADVDEYHRTVGAAIADLRDTLISFLRGSNDDK